MLKSNTSGGIPLKGKPKQFKQKNYPKSKEVGTSITFRAGENTEISRIFHVSGAKLDKEFILCNVEQNISQSMLFVSPAKSDELLTRKSKVSDKNTRDLEYVKTYRIQKGFKGNSFLNLESLIGKRVSFTKKQQITTPGNSHSNAPVIFTGLLEYSKNGVLVISNTIDNIEDNLSKRDKSNVDGTRKVISEIFSDQEIQSIKIEHDNYNHDKDVGKYNSNTPNEVMPVSDKLLVTLGNRNRTQSDKFTKNDNGISPERIAETRKRITEISPNFYPSGFDDTSSEDVESGASSFDDDYDNEYAGELGPQNLSHHIMNTLSRHSKLREEPQKETNVTLGKFLVEYDTNQISSSAVYQFELNEEGDSLSITMKLVVDNHGNISYDNTKISMVVDVQGDDANSIYDQVNLPVNAYGANYKKRSVSKSYEKQESYAVAQQRSYVVNAAPSSNLSDDSDEGIIGGYGSIESGDISEDENQMQNIIDLPDRISIKANDTSSITFFDRLIMKSKTRNFYEARAGSSEFQTELVWYKGNENFPGGTVNVYQVQNGGSHKISRGDFVIRSIGSSKKKVKNLLGKALGLSAKWVFEGVTNVSDHEATDGNSKEKDYKYSLTVTNQKSVDTEVFIKATFEGTSWRSIGKDITFVREVVPKDERSKTSAASGIATLLIPKNSRNQYTAIIRVSV